MGIEMEIIVRGRHITVPARFRQHATAKLAKLEKLDQKAVRVDVEVSEERNPRQADRRERVELTIRSRGPAIRAEASADDRYTALDLAFAKLESKLRRAADRRKVKHGDNLSVRSPGTLAAVAPLASGVSLAPRDGLAAVDGLAAGEGLVSGDELVLEAGLASAAGEAQADAAAAAGARLNGHGVARPRGGDMDDQVGGFEGTRPDGRDFGEAGSDEADFYEAGAESRFVPIQMEGDGPLVLREKVHPAKPMTIDQALLEMELVGHDFYLFHDCDCDRFSVVYRRRGYDYGVIRLVEE
jgi:ribosomal subunit interface protein